MMGQQANYTQILTENSIFPPTPQLYFPPPPSPPQLYLASSTNTPPLPVPLLYPLCTLPVSYCTLPETLLRLLCNFVSLFLHNFTLLLLLCNFYFPSLPLQLYFASNTTSTTTSCTPQYPSCDPLVSRLYHFVSLLQKKYIYI